LYPKEKYLIFVPALGVKVLRDKNGVLHFMDTKVWPFHYPFCVSLLGETRYAKAEANWI
jgi:hypothetical protein